MSVTAVVLPVERPTLPSARRARLAFAAGAMFVVAFAVVALFGSRIAPYRATELAGSSLQAPSGDHLFGTNLLGQDLFSQVILGTRISVQVALLASVGSVLVGGFVGVTAGWFGGLVDGLLMRLTDVVLVLPRLVLLLLVGALTGGGVTSIGLVIGLTFWPATARVLRAQVLTLRARTHVRAAVGFGAGTWHQLRRHILPDLALLGLAELIPAAARAVVIQAGLAFLGVGSPTAPSWGTISRDAINYRGLFLTPAWRWWLLPPIAAIVVLVVGITLIGTAAERRLSPCLSRHVQ